MAAQGASLQNYNNQLVAHLEALKEKRVEVEIQIQEEMKEKSKIERQIALLTDKLTLINRNFYLESLQKKLESRENYNRTIQETESAYMKILESSQTLLHVMKRESMNLAKKLNK
ncbi:hypothetical protein SteCoe_18648 [Stentor coeruleus]|uniref:Uncharacterized protein n=1 Tax=Stentor coeruleus TaxID=5963 RepID=A0A1R2BWB6_9CILI|nr:hypothetical protein SteCoe_18648 [Stentor coeruleus]